MTMTTGIEDHHLRKLAEALMLAGVLASNGRVDEAVALVKVAHLTHMGVEITAEQEADIRALMANPFNTEQ